MKHQNNYLRSLINIRYSHISMRVSAIALAILCSFSGSNALAAVVYQYTGNNFDEFNLSTGNLYDTSMSVTGSFTIDAPLINFSGTNARDFITHYTFSDGVNTLTEQNSDVLVSPSTPIIPGM